jgi:phosphoribosylformylglycinamidine synthase
VTAAEMAFAGALGLQLDLAAVPRPAGLNDDIIVLFSESPTRLLVEVRPAAAPAFEAALAGLPCARIGVASATPELVFAGTAGGEVLRASIAELKAAWQRTAVA